MNFFKSRQSKPNPILDVLDRCAENNSFPMLDNGYVYLAATRLAVFRAPSSGPLSDWALVIEVFGFSPRAGSPDTFIHTFASELHNRRTSENYVNSTAYENYLSRNPHNEQSAVWPVDFDSAQDPEDAELIKQSPATVRVREREIAVPRADAFAEYGIELAQPPRIQVFELCRYFAETMRTQVLATPEEQRISIRPEMHRILELDEWHHPDLVNDERPSKTETFQQLAEVIITGNPAYYRPAKAPNTHWRNWPEGGSL